MEFQGILGFLRANGIKIIDATLSWVWIFQSFLFHFLLFSCGFQLYFVCNHHILFYRQIQCSCLWRGIRTCQTIYFTGVFL